MNRRESVKAMIVAAGGVVALPALPAWAERWTKESLPAAPGVFSVDDQALLAAIADTIIPKGEAIGALSVGVDKFLAGLLAHCYEPAIQDNVRRQLAALNEKSNAVAGKAFGLCDQKQREALLLQFAASAEKDEKDFFDLMKAETIRGFNTSKEVLLGYHQYKVVPGHYYGCVDASI